MEDLTRRYFIMDRTLVKSEDEFQALEMCIGNMDTQRYSLDGTKLLIKTTQSTINFILSIYPKLTEQDILNNTFSTEYTLDDLQLIVNSKEWTNLEILL